MEIHLVEGIRRAVPDGQGDPQSENALVEALEGLFEKALSEAAAGELSEEGEDSLTQRREGTEITQEEAERLYEEIMAK